MIYTHGYTVFKDEEAARKYTEEKIRRSKKIFERDGKKCTEIVEKVKRKGKKEIHIFSFLSRKNVNFSNKKEKIC